MVMRHLGGCNEVNGDSHPEDAIEDLCVLGDTVRRAWPQIFREAAQRQEKFSLDHQIVGGSARNRSGSLGQHRAVAAAQTEPCVG